MVQRIPKDTVYTYEDKRNGIIIFMLKEIIRVHGDIHLMQCYLRSIRRTIILLRYFFFSTVHSAENWIGQEPTLTQHRASTVDDRRTYYKTIIISALTNIVLHYNLFLFRARTQWKLPIRRKRCSTGVPEQ